MASQPSDKEDGPEAAQPSVEGSLDAALDRAVPVGEPDAFLIAIGGKQAGRVFALSHNTVALGRAPDSDVFISDPSVSVRHARIINSSRGFEVEDLNSTNGTFVNGQRITRVMLHGGDHVTFGQAEFSFMLDRPNDATIAVFSPGTHMPVLAAQQNALTRSPASYYPPDGYRGPQPPYPYPYPQERERERDREDEGPSLAETVGRMVKAYQFLRQYFRLIGRLVVGGVALGLVSILVIPPAARAICEVKLQAQEKTNPMDAQSFHFAGADDDTVQFFAGAERAFTAPDLVASTLKKIPGADTSESNVNSIGGRLKFEPLPDHIYKATYKDKQFGGGHPPAVEFLDAHLKNYVKSEIDKALRVFTAQADFLRNQIQSVEKDMGQISSQRAQFREKNADRLPEEANLAQSSRFTLETHRADLTAQIRRLQAELDATRRTLSAEVPVSQGRFQASQSYRDSLAGVKRKLSEAYARGLADGHPEVKQLNDEKARLEALIEKEMQTETTQVDRQSNAGLQDLRSKVDLLQAQLSAARNDLADTEKSLGQAKHVVGDLPRVEEQVQALNHTQEATTRLHGQLFEQLKKAELQLNLERVSAESRYDVITRPQLEKRGRGLDIAIRSGIGLFLGLLVAAIMIAVKEGRRIVEQTLATMQERPGSSWR